MAKNKRKCGKVNPQLAELVRTLNERPFLVVLGNRELHEKLELAMALAKLTDRDHWCVVSRANLDPGQFPDLLLTRFPGKRVFVVFTVESFLPDFHQTKEDLERIWSGLQQLCTEHDVRVIGIINSLEDDDFWVTLGFEAAAHLVPKAQVVH